MSKPSHGTMRSAAGKKKMKKRPEYRPMPESVAPDQATVPVQPRAAVVDAPAASNVQFRPRARENARAAAGRSPARTAFQQIIDYSYVYADLKVIGVLCVLLIGGLVVLSFMMR